MSKTTDPLKHFQETLLEFVTKQRRGIRNPFVIVPVDPAYERKMTGALTNWQPQTDREETIPVQHIYLDEVLPKTDVYETVTSIPEKALESAQSTGSSGSESAEDLAQQRIEATLRENLAVEIVDVILNEHGDIRQNEEQIVLLLNLGSLYPFARASELLDELDRRRARSTVGIPFPGSVIGGKLAFFGDAEKARHYYPAHRVDQQITGEYLQ